MLQRLWIEVITIEIIDIFKFKREGVDEKGNVYGSFISTGYVPSIYEQIKTAGIDLPQTIFQEGVLM